MTTDVLEREQLVAARLPEVFEFYSAARNLEALTPPWLQFSVLSPEPLQMQTGTMIEYQLHLRGVPIRWLSRIELWEPGRRFVDRQLRGPYRLWIHRHEFAAEAGGTRIRDHVRYALPLWPLGEITHRAFVRRELAQIFDYRQNAAIRLLGGQPAGPLGGQPAG